MEQMTLFAIEPETVKSWLRTKALKSTAEMDGKTIQSHTRIRHTLLIRFTDESFIILNAPVINTLLDEAPAKLSLFFSMQEMNFIRELRNDESLAKI